MDPAGHAFTLAQALRDTAARWPNRGITIFDSRGRACSRHSYAELVRLAETCARQLAAAGVQPSDIVLIARPTGWDFVETWLGAIFCGALPLAVAPSRGLGTAAADLRRIESLAEALRPRLVLVGDALAEEIEPLACPRLSEAAITPRKLHSITPARSAATAHDIREPALLQLTSGTGGKARVVVLSHRAVLHNAAALGSAVTEAAGGIDAVVSWLPLHHDMGLIGALVLSIFTGRELTLLPPSAFLANPLSWLEQIGSQSRSLSFAPAFAFGFCCERLSSSARSADISRWRAAVCGAEMISASSMQEFAERFHAWGFEAAAVRPGYGLAEATLAVTLDRKGAGIRTRRNPNGTQSIVCVGAPVRETEVRIQAPDDSDRSERETGEICVRGPGLFSGYLALTGGDHDGHDALRDGWLHTGDLGFLDGGELYVTGRIKEVLSIRGEKFMPDEIESVAEAMPSGRLRAAAFSIPGHGTEQAILVVETENHDPAILTALNREIRARIADTLALPLADLVFVRRGQIPRTTSGKIQRAAARDLYQHGRLKRLRGAA